MGGKVEGVRSLLQFLVARTFAVRAAKGGTVVSRKVAERGVLQKVEQWQRGESA